MGTHKIYKLSKQQLHGWSKMSKKLRDKIVKANEMMIDSYIKGDDISERYLGIATRNMIAINAQNMTLDDVDTIQNKDNTIKKVTVEYVEQPLNPEHITGTNPQVQQAVEPPVADNPM